ncbi:9390_t:CDS:2 [Gigaspora margarita]|uniref:9390_t:CDS:1 n=1 Tax=Gigaspora margarita TaxID=4874 RepID=A0ABM8VWI0_GIGMA|nr:9390_t:CDS:2 [Gigaspora margarita]
MELTYSDTSAGDKIEVYEFLEALELLDNEVSPINMNDDDNNESDIDEEDNALKKLYQTREACYRNIVLMEFTRRLSDISDREKNRLFDAFSRSNAFGVKEHNALLDVLADSVKGRLYMPVTQLLISVDKGDRTP